MRLLATGCGHIKDGNDKTRYYEEFFEIYSDTCIGGTADAVFGTEDG